MFIYGDYDIKNNFLDVDEQEELIVLPKDIKSLSNCFTLDNKTKERKKAKQPL